MYEGPLNFFVSSGIGRCDLCPWLQIKNLPEKFLRIPEFLYLCDIKIISL